MDTTQSIIDELTKNGHLPEELPFERPNTTRVLNKAKTIGDMGTQNSKVWTSLINF